MELLAKINYLNCRQKEAKIFREQDKEMAWEICRCTSSLYKSKLIDILQYEKEEWSYQILKALIYDPDEIIGEKAVDILGKTFQREEDFWHLYEEADGVTRFVKAWIVAVTEYIGEQRGIEEKVIRQRMEEILKLSQRSIYIQIPIYEILFCNTHDDIYLQKILSHIAAKDHEVRYHIYYALEGILLNENLTGNELDQIENSLSLVDGIQEYRYNRIYRERIYRMLLEQRGEEVKKRYIEPREARFFSEISRELKEQETEDGLLKSYIFQLYYPVEDNAEPILQSLRSRKDEIKDERLLIFAAYIECIYGDWAENVFLERLQRKETESKAVVLLLQALWELEINPEELCNAKALELAERALTYDSDIPEIYDIIMQLTSIETKKHRWANEKSENLKEEISLKTIEKWPLDKLYSYDTFLNMTLLKKWKEPEDFWLKHTFSTED